MDSSEVVAQLLAFRDNRDWGKFHTAENLAKSICIEAGELLECFQWGDQTSTDDIRSELADVLTYCFLLSQALDSDPNQLILEKLQETNLKYPVEKSMGRSTKYDQL